MLITHYALRITPIFLLVFTAHAEPFLYNMGTPKSEVWTGFAKV